MGNGYSLVGNGRVESLQTACIKLPVRNREKYVLDKFVIKVEIYMDGFGRDFVTRLVKGKSTLLTGFTEFH